AQAASEPPAAEAKRRRRRAADLQAGAAAESLAAPGAEVVPSEQAGPAPSRDERPSEVAAGNGEVQVAPRPAVERVETETAPVSPPARPRPVEPRAEPAQATPAAAQPPAPARAERAEPEGVGEGQSRKERPAAAQGAP